FIPYPTAVNLIYNSPTTTILKFTLISYPFFKLLYIPPHAAIQCILSPKLLIYSLLVVFGIIQSFFGRVHLSAWYFVAVCHIHRLGLASTPQLSPGFVDMHKQVYIPLFSTLLDSDSRIKCYLRCIQKCFQLIIASGPLQNRMLNGLLVKCFCISG